jgi:Rhodanese-like domain
LQETVALIELNKQREEKLKNLEGSSIVPLGPQPPKGVTYASEADGTIEPPVGLLDEVESLTPSRIPGGTLLTTAELYAAFNHNKLGDYQKADAEGLKFVLVDAWSEGKHPTLPAAKRIPTAGRPGDFEDAIQKELWTSLQTLTGNDWKVPIVFFSRDVKHWAGYNGALRAIQAGFLHVYWYRGGIAAWKEAKQPLN